MVGHTGSGKSAWSRLIARFYEFQGGRILIDGHDIRTLDLASIARGWAWCRSRRFCSRARSRKIFATAGPTQPTPRSSVAALKLGGGEWVNDLPNGLQTDVGERGARLSLGQRQLVALARVLLQNPSIVILDEATASIDPFTETQIQEGLDLVMRAPHRIVIAHRLSTVRHADRIIVLREGAIIEEGTTSRCWRRAATTPSCTTPTSATSRWNMSWKVIRCPRWSFSRPPPAL